MGYLHLLIMTLMGFSLCCFSLTALFLIDHWKNALKMNKTSTNNQRDNFYVLLKLFVVMGIPWIGELMSGAIESRIYRNPDGTETGSFVATVVLDIINLLIGVVIFLLLICKKSILKKLKIKILGKTQDTSSPTDEYAMTETRRKTSETQQESIS